jgi:hypothetical protein
MCETISTLLFLLCNTSFVDRDFSATVSCVLFVHDSSGSPLRYNAGDGMSVSSHHIFHSDMCHYIQCHSTNVTTSCPMKVSLSLFGFSMYYVFFSIISKLTHLPHLFYILMSCWLSTYYFKFVFRSKPFCLIAKLGVFRILQSVPTETQQMPDVGPKHMRNCILKHLCPRSMEG